MIHMTTEFRSESWFDILTEISTKVDFRIFEKFWAIVRREKENKIHCPGFGFRKMSVYDLKEVQKKNLIQLSDS